MNTIIDISYIILVLSPIAIALIYYRKKSVDRKSGKSTVVWYEPPKDTNILEGSVLYSQHINSLTMYARLYEMAQAGQLDLQARNEEGKTKLRFKINNSMISEDDWFMLNRIGIDETRKYIYPSALQFSNEFSGVDTALEQRIVQNLARKDIKVTTRSSNYFTFMKLLIAVFASLFLMTWLEPLLPDTKTTDIVMGSIATFWFMFMIVGIILLFLIRGRRGKAAKQLHEYLLGYKRYLISTNYDKFTHYKLSKAEEGYITIKLKDEHIPWLILFSKNPNLLVDKINIH